MKLREIRELLKSGKPIQSQFGLTWEDVVEEQDIQFSAKPEKYRLKPESTYRPWKDASEVPPLALYRNKTWGTGVVAAIVDIRTISIIFGETSMTFEDAFNRGQISLDGGKTWTVAGVLNS
jgi:hypothetical protein